MRPRELGVLAEPASGRRNHEIVEKLSISENTVTRHTSPLPTRGVSEESWLSVSISHTMPNSAPVGYALNREIVSGPTGRRPVAAMGIWERQDDDTRSP
ncbi:LuxR C-terminal-related transcriptional regulator [Streptomyces sp. NRRL S-813]|uniref:LuxR C-terminal-related transcriptional regulator n=1 Tax=Streptomyces sp. NRRL S-813 TaxID=1463919 RepID=UPI003B641C3F